LATELRLVRWIMKFKMPLV